MRLAILATHPVQYQVPWFRGLAKQPGLDVDVFFCHQPSPREQAGAGFGKAFDWDIPLLDGYRSHFLRNVASQPGIADFAGLDTPEIGQIIGESKYTGVLVLGWHFKSAWQAMLASWRTRTPILVRGDSHLRTARSIGKRLFKEIAYRTFIPRLSACLAVGTWSAEYFRHYGARPDRIFWVPHVVDEDRFNQDGWCTEGERASVRARWGLDGRAMTFVFAGKLTAGKRPLDFIQAIERVASAGHRVVGLIVGDGPLRAECEAYASSHAVPAHFLGFLNQAEIPAAYAAADVLVLTSAETWGVVVNEAMCCGKACIVSDEVGCAPDLIRPGVTGSIFPMGNVAALAELMMEFSRNPGQVIRMGRHAREHVAAYSVTAAVDGVVDALRAVGRH